MKTYNKITNIPQFYNKKDLMEYCRIHPDSFLYKIETNKFCASKNWTKFYSKYLRITKNQSPRYYEFIGQSGKLPFYADIEYYWSCEYNKPITSFLTLFEAFTKDHNHQVLNNPLEWRITRATRPKTIDDRNYTYHSYHIVLNNNSDHFESQKHIKIYLKNMILWAQNNADETITKLWEDTCIEHPKNKEEPSIIDWNVYSDTYGTHQAFRMPLASKSNGDDVLLPWDVFDDRQLVDYNLSEYFVTNTDRFKKKSQPICVPLEWELKVPRVKKPIHFHQPKPLDTIPSYLNDKAKSIMGRDMPKSKFIKNEVTANGDYFFKFHNTTHKCLLHNRIHPDMTNNNHFLIYKPNSKEWYISCYSAYKDGKRALKINTNLYHDSILKWDYEYHDTDEIDCKPFIPTDELAEGGTFLLQAPKGTGKTEAMNAFITDEISKNPKAKILVVTYRIALATKYDHEFDHLEFGFHNYQNQITKQAQVDRMIVLIDSISKCLVGDFHQDKYDIIIMDEVYSILEGWDSGIMGTKKLALMSSFKILIQNCKYLYCMDAHLNNKLCINTLSKLRDTAKFISHRNPNCHPYNDYTVNWYEPQSRPNAKPCEQVDKIKWQNQFLDKLKQGKKLALVSSTKTMVNDMEVFINGLKHSGELPSDFEYRSYTSDTSAADKTKQLADVEHYWKSISCVLYSPTISAGTSFNLIDGNDGFDEIFVYFTTPSSNSASYNTLSQMLFRIRQLNDKQFHIFHDIRIGKWYYMDESQFGRDLLLNSETIFESFGTPPFQLAELDDKFRPTFDKTQWSWTLWLETSVTKIFYSKPKNFKTQMINELTNSPRDYITPGRGMKLIDHSLEVQPITEEDLEKIIIDKADKEAQIVITGENKMKTWAEIHSSEGLITDQTYDWIIQQKKSNIDVTKRYEILFKIKL